MISLIDFILNLFRDQNAAADYIAHPEQALLDAGLGNVAPAQIAAVAATAVPSVALGQGDPVLGLQRAVSNQWGFEPVYAPQRVFAPETNTDLLSGNRTDTDLASHNNVPLLSPDAGGDVQQGGFNLDFSDLTLGNRTSAEGDGAVAIGDENDGDILSGDGSALGDGNSVDNTDVRAGNDSIVTAGDRNDVDQDATRVNGDYSSTHDGTVIQTSGHGTTSSSQGNATVVDGNQTTTSIDGTGNASGVDDSTSVTHTSTTTTTTVDDHSFDYDRSVDYDYNSTQTHTTTVEDNDAYSTNVSDSYTSSSDDTSVHTHQNSGIDVGF